MSRKTTVRTLRQKNLLAIYDGASRKGQACQTNPDRVQAKRLRTAIRCHERFTGDSIAARDAYGLARWQSGGFQERIGATTIGRSIEAGPGR